MFIHFHCQFIKFVIKLQFYEEIYTYMIRNLQQDLSPLTSSQPRMITKSV